MHTFFPVPECKTRHQHSFAVMAETTPEWMMTSLFSEKVHLGTCFIPDNDGLFIVFLEQGSPLPLPTPTIVMDTWSVAYSQLQYPPFQPVHNMTDNWKALKFAGAIRVVSPCRNRAVIRKEATIADTRRVCWRTFGTAEMVLDSNLQENDWPLQFVQVFGKTALASLPVFVARAMGMFTQNDMKKYPGPFLLHVPILSSEEDRLKMWYNLRKPTGAAMLDAVGSDIGSECTVLVGYGPGRVVSENTIPHVIKEGDICPLLNPSRQQRKAFFSVAIPEECCLHASPTPAEIEEFLELATNTIMVSELAHTRKSAERTMIIVSDNCPQVAQLKKLLPQINGSWINSSLDMLQCNTDTDFEVLKRMGLDPSDTSIFNSKPETTLFALVSNLKSEVFTIRPTNIIKPPTPRPNLAPPIVHVVFQTMLTKRNDEVDCLIVVGISSASKSNNPDSYIAILAAILAQTKQLPVYFRFNVTTPNADPAFWYNNMNAFKPALLLAAAGAKFLINASLNTGPLMLRMYPTGRSVVRVEKDEVEPIQFRGFDPVKPFMRTINQERTTPLDYITTPRTSLFNISKSLANLEDTKIKEYVMALDAHDTQTQNFWGHHVVYDIIKDSISVATAASEWGDQNCVSALPLAPTYVSPMHFMAPYSVTGLGAPLSASMAMTPFMSGAVPFTSGTTRPSMLEVNMLRDTANVASIEQLEWRISELQRVMQRDRATGRKIDTEAQMSTLHHLQEQARTMRL